MACMTFLWDYILTFGMEVDLAWKSNEGPVPFSALLALY